MDRIWEKINLKQIGIFFVFTIIFLFEIIRLGDLPGLQMATEPTDMKELVSRCHNVYWSMGSYERKLTSSEWEQRMKMRRSIVTAVDMKKGHKIGERDLTAKRPGTGISVNEYEKVVGKVLKQDIRKDQIILSEFLWGKEIE